MPRPIEGRPPMYSFGVPSRIFRLWTLRLVRTASLALYAMGALAVIHGTSRATPLFAAPFLSFDTGNNPLSVVIGDTNGDGKPDLVLANYTSNTVSVLLGNGDGTFGGRRDFGTGNNPYSVAIGDLNGDGKLDLAVAIFDTRTAT